MEKCCFCDKEFTPGQMMDVTGGAAAGHRCCLGCGKLVTCQSCGDVGYAGDMCHLKGQTLCEVCYVEGLEQMTEKERMGYMSNLFPNLGFIGQCANA